MQSSLHSQPYLTESPIPDTASKGKLALLAGAGDLPLRAAKNGLDLGYDVFVYTIDKGNLSAFRRIVAPQRVQFIRPGLLNQNFQLVQKESIHQAIFVGKINKWILLQSPVMDNRALSLWKKLSRFNDDALMLAMIEEIEKEGIQILRQSDFLQDCFIQPGLYSKREPTEMERRDIEFGMTLAKEMGRLDVGQTVIVSNGMVLGVEAIEGTDQAIRRVKKWGGKQGGVVAKVEKPEQDLRFDIPTVGPRTLQSMKKANLKVLAVEAHKTLALELDKMVALADKWGMTLIAV